MPALSNSVKRNSAYSFGGIVTVLAWPTFTPEGLNSATYTYATNGAVATVVMDNNITPYLLEAEVETVSFSDNVQIGVNRFPKHSISLKFSGRSDGLNTVLKAFDLGRHTFCIKSATGKIVLIGGQNGLTAEKSDSGAGAGSTDFAGYDVTLSGAETSRAPTVAADAFTGLLTDVNLVSPVEG